MWMICSQSAARYEKRLKILHLTEVQQPQRATRRKTKVREHSFIDMHFQGCRRLLLQPNLKTETQEPACLLESRTSLEYRSISHSGRM